MSDSEDEYGPALPPGFPSSKKVDTSSDDESYGPALPASLSSKPEPSKGATRPRSPSQDSSDSESDSESDQSESDINSSKRQRTTIGPSIPAHLIQAKSTQHEAIEKESECIGPVLPSHLRHLEQLSASAKQNSGDSDSDDDIIGPSLGLQATGEERTSVAEFEMRAQKMHAKLTGKPDEEEEEAPVARETWMTELPAADRGKKQFGLANRNFRKNEAPQADSSWTDTPQEKERKEKEKAEGSGSGPKRKKAADHYIPTEKDKKMEKEIERYNKANRPDSLMAMHEKKLKKKKKKERKKEKKERKKNKKDKKPEERKPFDRDTDLAINKFDEAQKKAFIKRSQELTSRFKTGGMGTSFL